MRDLSEAVSGCDVPRFLYARVDNIKTLFNLRVWSATVEAPLVGTEPWRRIAARAFAAAGFETGGTQTNSLSYIKDNAKRWVETDKRLVCFRQHDFRQCMSTSLGNLRFFTFSMPEFTQAGARLRTNSPDTHHRNDIFTLLR